MDRLKTNILAYDLENFIDRTARADARKRAVIAVGIAFNRELTDQERDAIKDKV